MYKCEKGDKQYEKCKAYGMDYCSDCPHGIKLELIKMSEADKMFYELGKNIKDINYYRNYYTGELEAQIIFKEKKFN